MPGVRSGSRGDGWPALGGRRQRRRCSGVAWATSTQGWPGPWSWHSTPPSPASPSRPSGSWRSSLLGRTRRRSSGPSSAWRRCPSCSSRLPPSSSTRCRRRPSRRCRPSTIRWPSRRWPRSPPLSRRGSGLSGGHSCRPSPWWRCAIDGRTRSDAGRCAGPSLPCSSLVRCRCSTWPPQTADGQSANSLAGARLPVEVPFLLRIVATLLFQPVRSRLEALADRWVFGERVSGYDLLIRLGASLRETVGVGGVLPRLAAPLRAGLGLRWVRVRLILPGEMGADSTRAEGEPPGPAAAMIPIVHGGVELGAIECGPRADDDGALAPADLELVEGVARQGALAIRNAHLAAELQARLEEIREQASQLDQSRMRLVQAQVAERRRIERAIHDGAQQGIVSLIARARLARAQLESNPAAESTLVALQADAERVLADLRELVGGIHPAVLSDRGLVDAIEERAERLPVPVAVDADAAVRGNRYPDEIESAAFFLVSEAVANALKHAPPRRAAPPPAIRMPPGKRGGGAAAPPPTRRDHPRVGVVVLSHHAAPAYAMELFREGTAGLAYLPKERIGAVEEAARALRETAGGGSVM